MRISSVQIVGIFMLVLFYSCHCDDKTCAGFNKKYLDWLPYPVGDSIRFVNDVNDVIAFKAYNLFATEEKINHCTSVQSYGCKCDGCENIFASNSTETNDTSRKIVDAFGRTIQYFKYMNNEMNIVYPDSNNILLKYTILDQRNSFTISPALKINSGDSLLTSIVLGGKTYTDVIMHQVDTTLILSSNPIYNVYFVWKSYYTKQYGVVGFFDLKTHSLFYRKP